MKPSREQIEAAAAVVAVAVMVVDAAAAVAVVVVTAAVAVVAVTTIVSSANPAGKSQPQITRIISDLIRVVCGLLIYGPRA